jgi:hypothetical protein
MPALKLGFRRGLLLLEAPRCQPSSSSGMLGGSLTERLADQVGTGRGRGGGGSCGGGYVRGCQVGFVGMRMIDHGSRSRLLPIFSSVSHLSLLPLSLPPLSPPLPLLRPRPHPPPCSPPLHILTRALGRRPAVPHQARGHRRHLGHPGRRHRRWQQGLDRDFRPAAPLFFREPGGRPSGAAGRSRLRPGRLRWRAGRGTERFRRRGGH